MRPAPYLVMPYETLMELLQRAHEGEDPDLLYAEHHANAEHEDPENDGPP